MRNVIPGNGGGVFACLGQCQDAGEVSDDVHNRAAGLGISRYADIVNQRAQDIGSLGPAIAFIQGFGKDRDLLPIDLPHIGVDQNGLFSGVRKLVLQFLLARFKGDHPVLHLARGYAVADRIDQLFLLAVNAGKLGFGSFDRGIFRHSEFVQMTRILLGEDLAEFGLHKMGFQAVQHESFKAFPLDCPVIIAGPFVARRRAAHMGLRDHGETAAAVTAFNQARKQVFRTATVPEPVFLSFT